ncbi:MAG: hypothetical protein HYT14_01450 [Candidatus Liptonbacteria bacterium]|nr:hypothetical protein [Candidatus Liptonbacteria bacterium]
MPSVKAKKGASAAKTAKQKPIGTVTHYYGGLGVAIVKFTKAVETGTNVRFEGATTAFSQTISSLEYDHKPVSAAPKGKEVGVKVEGKVREGDHVYTAD